MLLRLMAFALLSAMTNESGTTPMVCSLESAYLAEE